MKKLSIICLFATTFAYSLDQSPWLGEVYGFNLNSEIIYSQYRYINHAETQPLYTYRNYLTREALSFTASQNLEMELEVELARTPHQFYGFRSVALGARYRALDDIAGNPLSLVVGASLRAVGGRSVRDVSSPYASYLNAEIMASVGKEFMADKDWKARGYLAGVLGLANHGSVWNRFEAIFEGKICSAQAIKAFMSGYFGYGPKSSIDINHFHGWGSIAHRSIDLGAQYSYSFARWGDLGLSYAYRVFARSYPQNEQTLQISYYLPFSLF